MFRKLMKVSMLPLLALGLVIAGCENLSEPSQALTGPSTEQLSRKGGGWQARYVLLASSGSVSTQQSATAQIGAAGGSLSAAGFSLHVPPGAVNRLTTFTMSALEDGTYGVALTATRKLWNGQVVDVGVKGFRKELLLSAPYSSFDDQLADASKLTVLWVKEDGAIVAVKSAVDVSDKIVYGWLAHFSDYAIGFPN